MMQGAQIRDSVTKERSGMGWHVGGKLKGEGPFVGLWLIHGDIWQKLIQYCKAIIFQLKMFKKKYSILPYD